MNPEKSPDVQVKLNFNAPSFAEFKKAYEFLTGQGAKPAVTVSLPSVPPEQKPLLGAAFTEKGENDFDDRERSGLERMRMPGDWQGKREDYANHRLAQLDAMPA